MKRVVYRIAVAALILIWGVAAADDTVGAKSPTLKVGVILPLSGPAANFGAIARNGIELALRDLTPDDRSRVQVVYEDDGLVNTRTATAARKLLDIDKVNALITWSSSSGLTIAGMCESKRVPQIAIASDPSVVKGKKYSFTYWPLPQDEARLLYDYLATSGVKRVAIITLSHNGALAIRDSFMDLATERGGVSVVASEEVASDLTDFRGVLNRIKQKGEIEGFLPVLFPGQLAIAIKQAREVGIVAPLYGFETFEDKDEYKASGGLLAGAVYATGGDPSAEFVARFEAAYPGSSYYTANQTYDALRLLVEATQSGVDSDRIVSFLRSLRNFPTASGLATSTGDNRFNLPCALKTIDANGTAMRVAGR
jgi:ABC-type branched-subunit amino acid transport system substrate-binding protein